MSMIDLLSNPFAFNILIMCLYALNAGQFVVRGYWADAFYWLCALGITASVTFGYKR